MKKNLEFILESSKILNSNSMPSHFIVKGNIVSHLRTVAANEGLSHHSLEGRPAAEKRYAAIKSEENWILMKKRARGKIKKKSPELDKKTIDAMVDEDYTSERPELFKNDIPVDYLFDKFKIKVTVNPPSRRRLDPPNLYPTVKALIDGLTDASWWEDDDFNHLQELSFVYGEPTKESGVFKLQLEIEECE